MLLKTEGFVLKNRKLGEADSLLTIFTRKLGKINAVAKGARKPRSPFLAGVQPFCYSEFVVYKGKNLYQVSSCDSKQIFYSIREDMDKLAYSAYLLELVEAVITEGQTNNRLFNLVGKTLSLMLMEEIELNTIVRAFELKLLHYAGFRPQFTSCVSCGGRGDLLFRFSISQGGILCGSCSGEDTAAVKISGTTIRLANYLMSKEIEEVYKLKINNFLNNELKNILKKYIFEHINIYHFKSLEIIEKL
jgi:DNA repair protein RecO (recombination protein O)